MSQVTLALEKRELTGKKAKKLREQGIIPSVIFGGKEEILAQSEYVETEKALNQVGYHSPITLTIGAKKQMALVKNVHVEPVKRKILNIEFQAVSAREVVEATAPIKLVGFEESEANKAHLSLSHILEEIEIKAKPSDLPEALELDASKLAAADDKITVADIVLPEGVELADKELDPETVIALVYDPAAEAAEREAKAEADKAAEETRAAEEATESEEAPAEEAAK